MPPVILGGGLAGIAAAMAMAEPDARPILLESRPWLGGRVRSFVHEGSGDEIDNGRHLITGAYEATLQLCEKLDTRRFLQEERGLRVEFRETDGTPRNLRAARYLPPPLDVAVGLLRIGGLSNTMRMTLLSILPKLARPRPNDAESAADWLVRIGVTPALRRRLFDPMIIATLNTAPENASATLFAAVLRLAFLKGGRAASLIVPTAGLSRLVAPAVAYIEERGGEVRLATTVRGLEREASDRWIVATSKGEIATDHVVSALPWHGAARLLGDHLDDLAFAPPVAEHNPIISLYLWFDRPLPRVPRFCALLDTRLEWVFDRRKIEGGTKAGSERSGLLEGVLSDAGDLLGRSDEEIVADCARELRSALPEIGNAAVVDALVIREKRATFAATPEIERMRPKPGRIADGLSICGDWTATGLPGTIEGAIRSGLTAAAS